MGASVTREPAGLVFLVAADNTGNVILKNVHGWVKVTSASREVAAATITPGTFVSATSISYPVLSRTSSQPLARATASRPRLLLPGWRRPPGQDRHVQPRRGRQAAELRRPQAAAVEPALALDRPGGCSS